MTSTEPASLQPVKGTRDFYPADMRIRSWLFDTWRRVSRSFGYEEYDACVLEHEDLYLRKAGDEIGAQLYNFADKGGRRVALRPEMTPSLARMVVAAGPQPLPLRWFSIPQCFRYERAQKGRKREHFQWNMDIAGLSGAAAEVELMSAQAAFLKEVGLRVDEGHSDVVFRVSNRSVLEHFLAEAGIVGDSFRTTCVIIDKLDKVGAPATLSALVASGLGVPAAERLLALLETRGMDVLRDAVGTSNPGHAALAELVELAACAGLSRAVSVDLSVVRGLSYYTGTVWELFDGSGLVPRAIAGGGRYDHLMESLGGRPTPMAGFGFGDIVIRLLLEERKLLPESSHHVDDLVYPLRRPQFGLATRLATTLRSRGRTVLVEFSERKFRTVLERAEELTVERIWVIGEDEVKAGALTLLTREAGGARRRESVPMSSVLAPDP